MPERKRRDDLETSTMLALENDLLKDESIELGAGCSISLGHNEEVPTVYVKTYGEVDVISLRRKLEQNYPGARIEGLHPDAPAHVRTKKKRQISSKKPNK
jgi:hypothetical protein